MSRNSVTKDECDRMRNGCDKRLSEMKDDIRLIKSALVGTDLRGGLVNQVNDLASQVSDMAASEKLIASQATSAAISRESREDKKEDVKKETLTRYKIALIAAAAAFGGIILGKLLEGVHF